MRLSEFSGQNAEICGKNYDYWGKVAHIDEKGVLLKDGKEIFVPWGEVVYITEKSKECAEYKVLERREKFRGVSLNIAIVAGGILVGLLVRWFL